MVRIRRNLFKGDSDMFVIAGQLTLPGVDPAAPVRVIVGPFSGDLAGSLQHKGRGEKYMFRARGRDAGVKVAIFDFDKSKFKIVGRFLDMIVAPKASK